MDLLEEYIKSGNLKDIQTLILKEDFKLDIGWKTYDLLKKSLVFEQQEIAKYFIENNFQVNGNSAYHRDQTPLHLAVKLGWKDIVILLLHKGASVEIIDTGTQMTPIQLSFLLKKYELTDLLLPYDKCRKICDSNNSDVSHFHIACARNCIETVKRYLQLVQSDCEYSVIDETHMIWPGYTPLHFAVEFQSKETVEILLKSGIRKMTIAVKDERGNTALHLAVESYNELIIDLILSEHMYVCSNPVNSNNLSHFHVACTRNNPKVVRGFLEFGVDINLKVQSGLWENCSALHLAVKYASTDVVKLLLPHTNIQGRDLYNLLFDAHRTGNSEIINLITSKINCNTSITDYHTVLPPLFKACMDPEEDEEDDEIKSLISLDNANDQLPLESPVWPGATPMHIVIETHENKTITCEIIDLLVASGADVTATDARGWTPIHVAIRKNFLVLKTLFRNYSSFESNLSDPEGLSLFHIACAADIRDAINWFLDDVGVDINAVVSKDSIKYSGFTPLHMASYYRNTKLVCELLNRGADITIKNGQGMTALDLSFQFWNSYFHNGHDHYDVMSCLIKLLKEQGLISFGSQGFNVLHAACIISDEDMVVRCCASSQLADVINSATSFTYARWSGFTPLHFAVLRGNSNIVKTLLDHGACPVAYTAKGNTPLDMAVDKMRYNVCKKWVIDDRLFLLQENPFNIRGFSHCHIASIFGNTEIVRWYLDHGFDPNNQRTLTPFCPSISITSKWAGKELSWPHATCLHLAVHNGHRDVVLLLLERGADPNARDMLRRTPLHEVLMFDPDGMITELTDRGADVNARDYDGMTPLAYYTCHAKYIAPDESLSPQRLLPQLAEKSFLMAGADVTLKNNKGYTVLDYIVVAYNEKKPDPICTLTKHVLSLCELGYDLYNEEYVQRALVFNVVNETAYRSQCRAELERMKHVRLDPMTTLVDALSVRCRRRLQLLGGNAIIRNIVTSKELDTIYPIYGYLARLQWRKGVKICGLIGKAVDALRILVQTQCPLLLAEVTEMVLVHLDNETLENVIQAADL